MWPRSIRANKQAFSFANRIFSILLWESEISLGKTSRFQPPALRKPNKRMPEMMKMNPSTQMRTQPVSAISHLTLFVSAALKVSRTQSEYNNSVSVKIAIRSHLVPRAEEEIPSPALWVQRTSKISRLSLSIITGTLRRVSLSVLAECSSSSQQGNLLHPVPKTYRRIVVRVGGLWSLCAPHKVWRQREVKVEDCTIWHHIKLVYKETSQSGFRTT